MKKSVTAMKVLKHALKLIDEPKKWLKGASAGVRVVNESMLKTLADDPRATCWCLSGAVQRASKDLGASVKVEQNAFNRIVNVLKRRHYNSYIPTFNDCHHTTHGKVLGVLKAAIKG